MCTAMSLQKKDGGYLFGRTMDIAYYFNQQPVVVPRGLALENRATGTLWHTEYAMAGTAMVYEGHPLFAEVQNQAGLGCAGLNFPQAQWQSHCLSGKQNLPPYDLVLWLCGHCATVEEVRDQMAGVALVGVAVAPQFPLPTLHWMVCDQRGDSLVIEVRAEGLFLYENPVGVMTNAPEFPWHLTNLRNYLGLRPADWPSCGVGELTLSPLGTGTGFTGLPGDDTSVSRFVRGAMIRNHLRLGEEDDVVGFFHGMDALSMVRGTVITGEEREDITAYTTCMDLAQGRYYIKTYQNPTIRGIDITKWGTEGGQLKTFPYWEPWTANFIS